MSDRPLHLYSDRVVLPLDGDHLEVVPAVVRVEGALITAVERRDRASVEASPPSGLDDLGGRLLGPAFVNGHTHLSMSAFRGVGIEAMQGNVVEDLYFRLEHELTDAEVRAFVRMGACESLLAGVGCVWDHYYHGIAVAEALADVGLCGIVAPTLQDVFGPGCETLETNLDQTRAIAEDAALARAGIVAALGPHATDTVSDALWRRVADEAATHQLPVHAHLAQSIEEFERSIAGHGVTPATRLHQLGVLDAAPRALLVHGLFLTDADLERLDPDRHVLGYCPFSQLLFGFPAHLSSWIRSGRRFTVGTDCGASNDSMSVHKELRLVASGSAFAATLSPEHAAFRASGTVADAKAAQDTRQQALIFRQPVATPEALLATVWSTPGTLHPGLSVGVIRPGAWANLVAWDLDHPAMWPATDPLRNLVMCDAPAAIDAMMLSGRWIGERGDFAASLLRRPEWREWRIEADARRRELFARVGLS